MTITVSVTPRDQVKSNITLRKEGLVPAVIYGPKHAPEQITVNAKELLKVVQTAGESSIIELTGLSSPVEVLVKDVAFDPVKRLLWHVDFYAIERGKDMTLHVPLEFINESPAEKDGLGTVTKVLHEIQITCRPSKIPAHVTVDLSKLVAVDNKITIADIHVPSGVVIGHESSETVAVISVQKPESDESVTEIDMDAIAVEEKGKTDTEATS